MTPIAPHLTAFFQQRLPLERGASLHTSDSYAYAFKLLLAYASERLRVTPSHLALEQIDAPLVVSFLNHLETARANRPSSRNVRLAAISPSCISWNIACPRHWSKFAASWPYHPRKPRRGWSDI